MCVSSVRSKTRMWKGASRDVGIFLVRESSRKESRLPQLFLRFSKARRANLFGPRVYRSPQHGNMSHLPLHCDSFEVDSPHVSYR